MRPYQDPEIEALLRYWLRSGDKTWVTSADLSRRTFIPLYTVRRYLPTMRGVQRSKHPVRTGERGKPAYEWRVRP